MLTVEYLEEKLNTISKMMVKEPRTQSNVEYIVLLGRLKTAYQAEYEKALKRPRPIVMDGEVIPYWSRYAKEYI